MNRAEEIKRLYTQTLFMAFAVLFVVFLVVINELESIFPGLRRMYLGGAVFGPSFILAHICAYRRCRRAGLIDEPVKTIEVIPRTVVNVVPERFGVWIRDRLTILLLLLGLVFYGSFAVYGWLELRKSGFDAVHHLASAFDVIVFAILAVFIVRSLLFPVAKLDDEGISGRHRGHFWRRVRWPDIDSCEIVTVSGENERVLSRSPVFKNAQGKVLLSFSTAWSLGVSPSDQQKFWSLLRHNLTGLEAEPGESNKISQA